MTAGVLTAAGLGFYYLQREDSTAAEPATTEPTAETTTVIAAKILSAGEHPVGSDSEAVKLEPRAAVFRIGAMQRTLAPNTRGEFPRLPVPPAATVAASVPFPEATPGEIIRVQAEDGGALQGPAAEGRVTLDARRHAQIEFQTSALDGLHRVTLQRGGEQRVLEFWVGPEPPALVRK